MSRTTATHQTEPGGAPVPWVNRLARLMDSRFRLPGTELRFGLDPIIGLIPVVGDSATAVIGTVMIGEALRLRLGPGVVLRMLLNLAVDWAVGLVPGIDLILDSAVKAHSKNAALLARASRKKYGRQHNKARKRKERDDS